MSRPLSLLLIVLALSACNQAEDTDAAETEQAYSPMPEPTDMWDEARLIAHSDGVMPKGHKLLRFGTPRDEVEALATDAFGAPGETSRKGDCGGGPMDFSQYGPIELGYQDGRLAGWHLRKGKEAMLADGVPVGWPLKALRQEREVRDIEPQPGGVFVFIDSNYGQITGFAEDDPGETITAFSAGMTCSFR